MTPNHSFQKRYWYAPDEDHESRSQRRLKNDLGMDEAACEAIIGLRSQVFKLQAQLRLLKLEHEAQVANQNLRLALFRESYYEASWIELEYQG